MDRLTTLVERFRLSVRAAPMDAANLFVLEPADGAPHQLVYFTRPTFDAPDQKTVQFAVQVDWSGQQNPLLAALPPKIRVSLDERSDTRTLVQLMRTEVTGNRCGAQSVINRLGEALMVGVLRSQIEAGTTRTGLLAGLADPRLSRAIVSIHDQPGRVWTNADLAQVAGLSLSRFVELFGQSVGETPMGYLRRWRLILARQDVQRGDRIDLVAHRYAYASSESFTRAFRRAYGVAPISLRNA